MTKKEWTKIAKRESIERLKWQAAIDADIKARAAEHEQRRQAQVAARAKPTGIMHWSPRRGIYYSEM